MTQLDVSTHADPSTPVQDLDVTALRIPTETPEADGTLRWDATGMVVVRVHAAGRTGTGWTFAPAAAGSLVRDLLAGGVVGADALSPASAHAAMVHAARNAGRPGLASMAISAVDIALWDLCARLHDLPLHRMWGVDATPVRVYGSGGFVNYDQRQLHAQLDRWLELGLDAVKIKIGQDAGAEQARDLARVEDTRNRVHNETGDRVSLFVDANGGYRVGQAARVGRSLDLLGVTWLEEPVSSDDLTGLRRVREMVAADVAAGEYGYDLNYFQRMAASGAVDCLQVDVTRCGGYTEWHRIAAVAAAHGLDVSAHCAPYLTLAAATATGNLRHLEWFHDHVRIAGTLIDGYADPQGGQLFPSATPGHGLSLCDAEAEKYKVA